MNSIFSIAQLLTGLSKSLGIANKILPIINDYKPLVNNIKNIYSVFNNDKYGEKISNLSEDNYLNKKEINNKRTITQDNSPKFFI